jgi:hypothetical protein
VVAVEGEELRAVIEGEHGAVGEGQLDEAAVADVHAGAAAKGLTSACGVRRAGRVVRGDLDGAADPLHASFVGAELRCGAERGRRGLRSRARGESERGSQDGNRHAHEGPPSDERIRHDRWCSEPH